MKLSLLTAFLLFDLQASAQTMRDYSLMSHRIFIDSLRAGNHDDSGVNEYYFTFQLNAIRNTKDDLVKPVEERPVIHQDPKEFGGVSVPVLSNWKHEGPAEEALFIDIDGDEIRSIVAESMREFSVKESEIALIGVVTLWERNKFLVYFGEDTKVGQVKFYPIPASEYHAAARTNLKLSIEDEQGTMVSVKVRYESPRKAKSDRQVEKEEEVSKSESTPEISKK